MSDPYEEDTSTYGPGYGFGSHTPEKQGLAFIRKMNAARNAEKVYKMTNERIAKERAERAAQNARFQPFKNVDYPEPVPNNGWTPQGRINAIRAALKRAEEEKATTFREAEERGARSVTSPEAKARTISVGVAGRSGMRSFLKGNMTKYRGGRRTQKHRKSRKHRRSHRHRKTRSS